MPNWSNFFAAEAGAAAALAGLLFVAVSINLVRILEFPHLPTRAAEALIALLSVLFVASFALIPGQSLRTFGIEIAATGMAVWTFQAVALTRTRTRTHPRVVLRVLMNQVPPLPVSDRRRITDRRPSPWRLLACPRCIPCVHCRNFRCLGTVN